MSIDSHRMVFTFLSWLDWLGVARASWISILKNFRLLHNYGHRITDIISFVIHLESPSGHSLSFYLHLVKYRFTNMFPRESHPVFYGDLVAKKDQMRKEFRLVGLENSQTPSMSKV